MNFGSKTAGKSARGHLNSKIIFGINLHGHKYICTKSGALVTKNEFSMKKFQISLVFLPFSGEYAPKRGVQISLFNVNMLH